MFYFPDNSINIIKQYSTGVIANYIYTEEDAEFLGVPLRRFTDYFYRKWG